MYGAGNAIGEGIAGERLVGDSALGGGCSRDGSIENPDGDGFVREGSLGGGRVKISTGKDALDCSDVDIAIGEGALGGSYVEIAIEEIEDGTLADADDVWFQLHGYKRLVIESIIHVILKTRGFGKGAFSCVGKFMIAESMPLRAH